MLGNSNENQISSQTTFVSKQASSKQYGRFEWLMNIKKKKKSYIKKNLYKN